MEERRHKNRRVVASGEEPRCVVHDVPDDLLRLILLRLDSPLWILRAACACKRWRRVVSGDGRDNGRAFLRLARSLHPPAVVGHYQNNTKGADRRFVPSPPWPTIAGSRLSLDFIPSLVTGTAPIESWEVADCHAGLVLLRERTGCLSDLVVCDPLTRRYRRIHHPLAQWSRRVGAYYTANMFLIDGDNGNTSVTNFRVLYRSDDDDEYRRRSQLYVFSIEDGGDVGDDWRFVRRSERDDRYRDGFGRVAGRVDGSLYLGLQAGGLAVLDEAKLEFSKVDLPSIHLNRSFLYPNIHAGRSAFAVVHSAAIADPDAALPSPPAVFIVHVHGEALELFRLARGSGAGDGDGEWVLEHSIPKLSTATRGLPGYPDHKRFWWQTVEVIAGGTGIAVLSAWVSDNKRGKSLTWLFSFNVDTMELQAVTNEDAYCGKTVTSTYTLPWPRVLRASRPLKPKSVSPIKANPTFFQFPRTS